MKKLSTIFAAGTMALALSAPVLAGPVGVSKDYTAQPDDQTIADLQQASGAAQREAREGNKDNPAFCAEELPNRSAHRAHQGWAAGLTEPGRRSASTGLGLVTNTIQRGGGERPMFQSPPRLGLCAAEFHAL